MVQLVQGKLGLQRSKLQNSPKAATLQAAAGTHFSDTPEKI